MTDDGIPDANTVTTDDHESEKAEKPMTPLPAFKMLIIIIVQLNEAIMIVHVSYKVFCKVRRVQERHKCKVTLRKHCT